jgi:hypothetical protein
MSDPLALVASPMQHIQFLNTQLNNISAQFNLVFVRIQHVQKGKCMPISRLELTYLMSEEYKSPALSSLLQVNVVRDFRIPPRSR